MIAQVGMGNRLSLTKCCPCMLLEDLNIIQVSMEATLLKSLGCTHYSLNAPTCCTLVTTPVSLCLSNSFIYFNNLMLILNWFPSC